MLKIRSEQFHQSLIAQYREQIREALLESESEYRTRLDVGKLNAFLRKIFRAAESDGLKEDEINRLIDEETAQQPSYQRSA